MQTWLLWSASIALAVLSVPACATITGLNQIPTPDIQEQGLLSISYQDEHDGLGSPRQLQIELGLSPSWAVALYQSLSPPKTFLNAEVALVRTDRFLVSAGALGTERLTGYSPFVEAGYETGRTQLIAGALRQDRRHLALLGLAYRAAPGVLLAADYISGAEGYATAGIVYDITPAVSINPILYVSNRSPHSQFLYGSVTWNISLW